MKVVGEAGSLEKNTMSITALQSRRGVWSVQLPHEPLGQQRAHICSGEQPQFRLCFPSCYNIREAAKGLGLSSSPARWENNFDCPPGLSGVWQLTQANCSTQQRLLFCPSSLGSLFSLPPRDSGIR